MVSWLPDKSHKDFKHVKNLDMKNEDSNTESHALYKLLAIGTADIPENLKRKSILCLYRDGTWTTGENVKEGWVVMVDVPRYLAVCVQDFHGKYRHMDGFWWHQCDEARQGDWLLVNYIFSVYFSEKDARTDDDEVIGRILLTNYAYIDEKGNVEVAV